MKLRETISDVLDAIISAPEAIRELREYAKEMNCRALANANMLDANRSVTGLMNEKSVLQFQLSCSQKRIAELEIENRKLQEANLSLALERDKFRDEISKLCRKITSLESDVDELRGGKSPAIEPPDTGEGFELCEKLDATEASYCDEFDDWGAWDKLDEFAFSEPSNRYAFRRQKLISGNES